MQTVEKGMEPYTAAGTTAEIEKHTGPLYQPQRLPTKIGEAALQSAPYALLGDPEQMIPNTVRALLSGGVPVSAGFCAVLLNDLTALGTRVPGVTNCDARNIPRARIGRRTRIRVHAGSF